MSIGAGFSTLGAAGAHALPAEQFGVGSAVGSTARQLGAVLGVALLVAVLGTPTPTGALAAFHDAWRLTAVAAAAAALVCLGLSRPATVRA